MRRVTSCLVLLAAVGAAPVAGGCAVPVRAVDVGPDDVYASRKADVLLGGEPSVAARLVLERSDLFAAWVEDPESALVALHDAATRADTRERLYGLAELSLAQGLDSEEPRWFLGAAVYSWLYLFGKADEPPPGPFDPRFRRACDLYARGVSEAFRDGRGFEPRAGRLALPVGEIDVAVPSATVTVGDAVLAEFECADDFEVRGMRSRVRTEGLGVPLIGVRASAEALSDATLRAGHMPPRLRTAVSAVLRVEGEISDLADGRARAVLELFSPLDVRSVDVRGTEVPLTVDFTAPIALGLGESALWDFELGAFLSRDEQKIPNGLILTTPYQRGKIPLVLVHGTASSPARWAELFNELNADPVIAKRYQCWLFIYGTGSPILTSAASLRTSLRETFHALDPDGTDPALRRVVVAGHSQGGLLTRLLVTSSGDRFWRNVSDEPFDTLDLEPEERSYLQGALFFEPMPEIERVIFVATPHRGSFVAGNIFGRIGAALISLPKTLVQETSAAVTRNFAKIRGDVAGSLPTAVDNMKPGSTFVQALGDLPIGPRVHVNSIVAVDGDGPAEEGDDGVVAYESAHLPAAESEIVVRSPHSCQGHPRTILEIRRILREHAAADPLER